MVLGHILSALLIPAALAASPPSINPAVAACHGIAVALPGKVFYPGSAQYANDTEHWTPSSSKNATCSVEPSTATDVATIVHLLDTVYTTTAFAVKGGGHAQNQNFSSTTGVQIAMRRFNEVKYNSKSGTVFVGAGNLWDNVYQTLDGSGVNVLGGRVSGVGVAGFALGGGYSWLAGEYGLTIDSVVSYEIVLPNATIVNVTSNSHPDLFFGLKGGLHNFGIVTTFEMKAYPQGEIWGGLINWNSSQVPAAVDAIVNFTTSNTDPKANLVIAFIGSNESVSISMLTFYNGPAPGPTFDQFISLPYDNRDLQTRSFYANFEAVSPPYFNLAHQRGAIASPRISNLTGPVIKEVVDQLAYYATKGKLTPDFSISCAIEPFVPSGIVQPDWQATAYPHNVFLSPLNVIPMWDDAATDAAGIDVAISVAQAIEQASGLSTEAIDEIIAYPNYCDSSTPLERMYGGNLPRLQQVAAKYDPKKLMLRTGGGFLFQA